MIQDLLRRDPELHGYAALPEMDPLTEEGALQEAQLLDIRFDALRLRVGMLFELRTALQLREVNTGVLVAHGVRALSWEAEPRSTTRTAWAVGGSVPRNEGRLFGLTLGMWPGVHLELSAESAAFFALTSPVWI
jgi:hypothetical protein